ncbi:hypothetical protein IMPR6_70105 [Imperialibacter sp. EC-SDR9]|nr:hypothetical protein IMPERIA89_60147 [Imperialibacter sp. 89]CAD5290704.1 hypothetical protein IMPERIA75_630144 [Imperialibacter sp. 75]VVT34464.1 hypothetical protein IMPR6_70105 [Imperialibacter sp. EC-SDR9]
MPIFSMAIEILAFHHFTSNEKINYGSYLLVEIIRLIILRDQPTFFQL